MKVRITIATTFVVLAPLTLAACKDSTGPDTPLVWSTVASGTAGGLGGVWGTSSSDVWAVGFETILHFNGATWSPAATPPALAGWGLDDIWGSSASDVWAIGADGALHPLVLHYNGASWSTVASSAPQEPRGVWGSSASDIWVVGEHGMIIHYNGTSWSVVSSPTLNSLYAVWGISASDVWAVGPSIILHYDGTTWTPAPRTSNALFGVWGSSRSDVWAVGDAPQHYDGVRWSQISSGVLPAVSLKMWGSSRSNAWVVGGYQITGTCCPGKISHYNGTTWSDVPIEAQPFLNDVWGSSATDVWVVGDFGTILHGAPAG